MHVTATVLQAPEPALSVHGIVVVVVVEVVVVVVLVVVVVVVVGQTPILKYLYNQTLPAKSTL